jgi:hypothetical protein
VEITNKLCGAAVEITHTLCGAAVEVANKLCDTADEVTKGLGGGISVDVRKYILITALCSALYAGYILLKPANDEAVKKAIGGERKRRKQPRNPGNEEHLPYSNKIEEHFEFFTRTLRENFKES